ncbi:exosortase A [Thalassotalea nanhaiensis]|uniref:Exosortase A n=1 Tax=Thalassotalea nanhaiensis TaxID=3065648 RepID=A0ABY9TL21_9GAMM|nr:exosortase A [Colwelliaceae bacterium SQ345]
MDSKTIRPQLFVALAIFSGFYISIFYSTFQKLLNTWTQSNTYSHGFFIIPLVIWLIYQQKHKLQEVIFGPSWLGVFLTLIISIMWFVGTLSGINIVEQFFLFLIPTSICLALLGLDLTKTLKFPLFFLLFAIPVGDFLIPYLLFITADISVGLTKILNIPIYRDGMYIQIPNGKFVVSEACSGIRFLISTVTIGVLYSYLFLTGFWKKALFITLCFVVSIVGNGIRAFLIILIGYLSDMQAAVGFDHLVYGWFFFCVILLILFVIGNRLSDKELPQYDIKESNFKKNVNFPSYWFIFLTLIFMSFGPFLNYIYKQKENDIKAELVTLDNGKQKDFPPLQWQPTFPHADSLDYKKVSTKGSFIDVFTATYYFETDRKELISFQNKLFDETIWTISDISNGEVELATGKQIVYQQILIVNSLGKERIIRLIYQVGNSFLANKLHVKALQLYNKLTFSDLGGKAFILSMDNSLGANETLDKYMQNNLQELLLVEVNHAN